MPFKRLNQIKKKLKVAGGKPKPKPKGQNKNPYINFRRKRFVDCLNN